MRKADRFRAPFDKLQQDLCAVHIVEVAVAPEDTLLQALGVRTALHHFHIVVGFASSQVPLIWPISVATAQRSP